MIIGLCGFAGSGKDETARALVEELGFTRLAFADALKNVLQDVNPIVNATWRLSATLEDGWEEAKKYGEVRELLQRLGVACRDHIDPDIWVKALMRQADDVSERGGHVVVSDVRFPNEIQAIQHRGGKLWRIDRPGVGPANDHISEHAWTDARFDRVLNNCGPIETLRFRAVAAAQHTLEGCCA